jgi:hypothetical protein
MKEEVVRTERDGTQALFVIDWLMNWEAERKNESQVFHFGKRGRAWHVGHLTYYKWDCEKRVPLPVHVTVDQILANGNQKCGLTTLSFLEAAMRMISDELPHLERLHLSSDNASNYHRKELTLSIPVLNAMSIGVKIDMIVHTETQDGKGGCDSHGAIAKRRVRQYLLSRDETTEYKKVDTPKQLAEALASNGGIQNNGMHIYYMLANNCVVVGNKFDSA